MTPLRHLLTVALVAAGLGPVAAADRRPPNVVVILADDVGYGDLSCYGATQVKTPNLDRLAAAGMRFTDGHSPSAMCTPTRYALLTGQYAWRHPPATTILSGTASLCVPPDRLTLPKLLKEAGYATGVVGKWHLGLGAGGPTDYNGAIKPGPREVGFDTSFIIPATGDRVPCVYIENGRVVGYDPKDPIRVSFREKVGAEPTGKENPDQLKVKLTPGRGHDGTIVNGISRIGFMSGGQSARWKDEDMADMLTAKATEFIAAHKAGPFFLYFSAHDIHAPRVPHPRFRGTSPHGTRGDALHQLDWCVGAVLAALDKHGLADDTLVLFSSDNGGVQVDGYADGAAEDKSGHQNNGPLRGHKGEVWEGGHRVPFIARWPGKVPAGKVSNELVCLVDLMATAAALTGRSLPPTAAPDSLDLSPALFAERPARPARDELVMHSGGAWLAVRKGNWVLVPSRAEARKGAVGKPQLFDLSADFGQRTDLAGKKSDTVNELTALLERTKGAGGTRPGWSPR
jgi:arylsulfatase A-like enzyme